MFKFKNKGKKLNNLNNELDDLVEVLDDDNIENKSKENRLIFLIKKIFSNKVSSAITIIILLVGILVLLQANNNSLSSTFYAVLSRVGLYSNTKKEVKLYSGDNTDDPGAWRVTKSATLTGSNTAQINIKVDSKMDVVEDTKKDVIFVIDTSGTMNDDGKFDKLKTDLKEVTKYIVENETGSINLVTLDTTSSIVFPTGFSSNINEINNKIDELTASGLTNYNAALKNVLNIMEKYNKVDDTDIVTVFLTDGKPNKDTPNQIATYKILKEKYPYMKINGIQFDMGTTIANEIKEITDEQIIADKDSLLRALYDASISPKVYETFNLEDYVNTEYFDFKEEDITYTDGKTIIDSNIIKWDLSNVLITGLSSELTINLRIKDGVDTSDKDLSTNNKLTVISKIEGEKTITKNINETPVLRTTYDVIYDKNYPKSCSNTNSINKFSKNVFDKVEIDYSTEPECKGYLFKGWVIDSKDDNDIQMINDETFIMPQHDVNIKATWTKQSVVKRMEGTVHEKTTLYKRIASLSGVDNSNVLEYTGKTNDSMIDGLTKQTIYYYKDNDSTSDDDSTNTNNVIFGGFCWQIVRTTDTGGVKLIYNGEAVNGTCENNRTNHDGYAVVDGSYNTNFYDYNNNVTVTDDGHYSSNAGTTLNLSNTSDYYYGSSYEYDKNSKKFKLIDASQISWNGSNFNEIIGKYTCGSSTESNCDVLYYIVSPKTKNSNIVYTYKITNDVKYYQIGKIQYNSSYDSLSYVGYKNNSNYKTNVKYYGTSEIILTNDKIDEEWYFTSFDYVDVDSDNGLFSFKSTGTDTTSNSNLQKIGDLDKNSDYSQLVGKYTLKNSYPNYVGDRIYFIVGVSDDNSYLYCVSLNTDEFNQVKSSSYDALDLLKYSITYGTSFTYNSDDGTYTINDASSDTTFDNYDYRKNDNYLKLKGKYVCNSYDFSTNKCKNLKYVYDVDSTNIFYATDFQQYSSKESLFKYKFGKGIEYNSDTNSYTLTDTVDIDYTSEDDRNKISNYHYTCWDENGICENVSYVHYLKDDEDFKRINSYYISLSNGKTVEDALNEMLTDNTYDSTIKIAIDAWYKQYMNSYTKYLEKDVVFCNNRNINSYGGWSSTNGNIRESLTFASYNNTLSLECANESDKFSVSNSKAQLINPVGLLTSDEYKLINSSNYYKNLNTRSKYWFMTPYEYNWSESKVVGTYPYSTTSSLGNFVTFNELGIRPVISLLPDTEYTSGNGTATNPYIIDDGINYSSSSVGD